jgi:thiol-disulfide isomerase/thioredoxin
MKNRKLFSMFSTLQKPGMSLLLLLILLGPALGQEKAAKNDSTSDEKKQELKSDQRLLAWNNGNVLPGALLKGDESDLYWNSDLFRGELQIDLNALNNIKFPRDETQRATKEKYFVRTLNGDKLYGEIQKIDEDGLTLTSERHGEITITNDQISKLVHLGNAGYVFMGISDLEDWGSLKRTKKHWRISDSGDLESTKNDINLFYQTDLPDAVQIDLVVKWEKNLDMVFGLGVPTNAKILDETLPRIESWEDSLVLNQEEDFSIIYESIDEKQKRLVLQIQWDRKTNTVVIMDEQGQELCTSTVPDKIRGVEPGIYLENKTGDLKVETLRISKTAAGYDPSKKGVQLTDGTIAYGDLVSYDGKEWTVLDPETEEETTVPTEKFRTALVKVAAVETKDINTLIRFQDGSLLTGTMDSIDEESINLKTIFSEDSVSSQLAGISVIRFLGMKDGDDLKGSHTLYSDYGKLFGQVFAGSGEDNDVLRWKPVGCKTGLPLTNADAKILLSNEITMTPDEDQEYPDTIYFVNKDTIPCKILSIDEEQVVFESFAENDRVQQSLIKAIDFSAMRVSGPVSCLDAGWYFSDKAEKSIEVENDEEMIIRGTGVFGHSSLAAVGSLKFSLEWKSGNYNSLDIRNFVRSPKNTSGGLGLKILLWDNMVMISDAEQNRMVANQQIQTPNNKADIEIKLKDGKLTVLVGRKKAFTRNVTAKAMKGNAVSFNLSNMNGNAKPQVTLSNISINNSGSGSSPTFVDPEKKELLLTIPRLRKDNPPKHILCARNSDLLRGELTAMNEDRILFESRLDNFTFERQVVSSIVWLHAKTPKQIEKEKEAEENAAKEKEKGEKQTESDAQTVQILMKGGQRLTVDAQLLSDETLNGYSDTLGKCSIPIDDIKELRMGKFATEATDVAYADWVAKAAPEPVLEDESGANPESFGKTSPLIGKKAKDFSLKLLDGKTFKLSENKGKVIVLDFWATWCGPCVKALPDMIRATDRFDPDKVVFIAVNQLEEPELIKMFMKRREMEMQVGLDNGDIGDLFDVTSIPQTVIIDQEGKIAFLKVGAEADLENKMGKAIEGVLGIQAPSADAQPPAIQPPGLVPPAGDGKDSNEETDEEN